MKLILTHLKKEGMRLLNDEQGADMAEWTVLLAAVIIPSWFLLMYTYQTIVIWYQMITQVNSFPSP